MEVNIKETFSAFNITYLRRLLKVDRAPFAGSVTNAQNPKCVNYISFASIKVYFITSLTSKHIQKITH